MRIVTLSDTHNNIVRDMPEGDLLIHAGDLTNMGTIPEIKAQLNWLSSLRDRYSHIVFIAGNHDYLFERQPSMARMLVEEHPELIYLEDDFVIFEGMKIWGSPVTPRFNNWAFNRDDDIKRNWDMVHDDVDILVTHGPPKYVLDYFEGNHVGDVELARRVLEISPKLHVFGHIHFAAGMKSYPNFRKGQSWAVNAAVTDGRNRVVRGPVEIELEDAMT